MASIKCGHCDQTHNSVREVRACYETERFQRHANMSQTFGAGHVRKLPDMHLTSDVLGSHAAVDASHHAHGYGAPGTTAAVDATFPSKPEPVEITEGFWQIDDVVYKVQRSQSSGHLYAKILDVEPGEGGAPRTTWTYAPGAMRDLRNGAVPLTEADAAEFGKLYGVCLLCGRTLTNEESIARGIGPVCAGKQGW